MTRLTRAFRRTPRPVFVVLVLACASEEPPSFDWCESLDGEPVVFAAGASRWQRERVTLRFVEIWRRGGTRDGEELIFPFAMAVSPVHGRVALADFRLEQTVVIGANGEWEGPWTRQGSGPGEVRSPLGVAWDTAGHLVVYDIGRHVLLRLAAPDSVFSETSVPPAFGGPVFQSGSFEWTATQPDGTLFIEPSPQPLDEDLVETRILRWSPATGRIDTVAADTLPVVPGPEPDMILPGAPRPVLAPAMAGGFAAGGGDGHYRIRLIGPDDRPERTLCRDVATLPMTGSENGTETPSELAEGPDTERMLAAIRDAPRREPPAPFARMFYGSDGRLWVQRDRPEPLNAQDRYFGVAGATWDVFSPAGEWLGETIAPSAVRIMAATDAVAYAIEESADGALWLVALRLELAPS